MIVVKIYWNCDENGVPVPDDVDLEDGPLSYYGPFDSITDAISWMENDYPEDDPDVEEWSLEEDFDPEEDVPINAPDSIWGDIPDEDIRDDSQEIHGS